MKYAQLVLLAAILAVLAMIAIDLHRLQASFIFRAPSEAALRAARTKPETREERNERIRREQRELEEDLKVIWEPSPKGPSAPAKK